MSFVRIIPRIIIA